VVRFDHASQFADVASNGKLFDWVKLQLKTLPGLASPRRTAVAERVAPASGKSASAETQR
jgi:hypothetical protein